MKDFEGDRSRRRGLEKRVMSDRGRRIVAYHESGHAIVASVLRAGSVHKISSCSGASVRSATRCSCRSERYLMTRTDLLGQLAVLLGGRTAEEIAFGEISTGAQNDLQRATDIARAMVTEFGMSDLVGLVNHNGHKRNPFLETPFIQERGAYAEQTALLIDTEVKRILTESHAEARRVLQEHRQVLDALSARLLEVEVVESAELLALLGPLPPRAADALPAEIPPV
jgi:cell division protease FtsH